MIPFLKIRKIRQVDPRETAVRSERLYLCSPSTSIISRNCTKQYLLWSVNLRKTQVVCHWKDHQLNSIEATVLKLMVPGCCRRCLIAPKCIATRRNSAYDQIWPFW